MYQYVKFCLNGAGLALAAMLLIEIVDRLLLLSPTGYLVSTLVIYGLGIVANYFLQMRYVFTERANRTSLRKFGYFLAASVIYALMTSGLSYILRYELEWPAFMAGAVAALAFGVSCLVVSVVSFAINRTWIFGEDGR